MMPNKTATTVAAFCLFCPLLALFQTMKTSADRARGKEREIERERDREGKRERERERAREVGLLLEAPLGSSQHKAPTPPPTTYVSVKVRVSHKIRAGKREKDRH
jgi:hypothetical protein